MRNILATTFATLGLIVSSWSSPLPPVPPDTIVCFMIRTGPPIVASTSGTPVTGLQLAVDVTPATLETTGFTGGWDFVNGGIGAFYGCHDFWLNIGTSTKSYKPLSWAFDNQVTTNWIASEGSKITAACDINAVKADINVYASQYPYVKGIFLDEAAADSGKLPYYKALYDYIMGMPGWSYDVINPGIIPDSGYLAASTQIVTLENYGSEVAAHSAPSYGSCNNKEKFVAIVHTVNRDNMENIISSINNKKYFGYIYITDGPGGCCTYNYLATYYAAQAQYIGTLSA